jgi:hypothetical protein
LTGKVYQDHTSGVGGLIQLIIFMDELPKPSPEKY